MATARRLVLIVLVAASLYGLYRRAQPHPLSGLELSIVVLIMSCSFFFIVLFDYITIERANKKLSKEERRAAREALATEIVERLYARWRKGRDDR